MYSRSLKLLLLHSSIEFCLFNHAHYLRNMNVRAKSSCSNEVLMNIVCHSFDAFLMIGTSSATEGADSRPASGPGTPTDEKAGQVGMGTSGNDQLRPEAINYPFISQLQRR